MSDIHTTHIFNSTEEHNLLALLCDRYGSDKGSLTESGHYYNWPAHTYTNFYGLLFGHCRNHIKTVFECGLGTNNTQLPSSMGLHGQPGASLRVWRDYFPNAQIYGADIDRDILFNEERIKTVYVDQCNPQSIQDMWSHIAEPSIDFILDDGLHVFDAGRCLFENSIQKLSDSGIYIIEDVTEGDMSKYQDYFTQIGPQQYAVNFINMHRPRHGLGDNALVMIRKQQPLN